VSVGQAGRELHRGAQLLLGLVALALLQLAPRVPDQRQADRTEAVDVALHASAADLAERARLGLLVPCGVGGHVCGPHGLERAREGGRRRRRRCPGGRGPAGL
jgi:hypothetical protein